MLDAVISDAADQEVHEVVIGMAHRGRLNVLANILGKSHTKPSSPSLRAASTRIRSTGRVM